MTFVACLFLSIGMALAQSRVSGKVTSAEDGHPVVGATVKVVGQKNTGTVTDVDGNFTLNVPAGAKIEISYIGMLSKTVKAGNNMNILLESDQQNLDEVMVVAYGTQKKSSFTGSAASVDSKKLANRPVANVTKALDGQVAGVTVTSGSGQPGSGSSMVIRGFGSINASNSPLYVVDGIPYDGSISSINPSDIEQITVLKDASASALYGARGANGVVMITTKRGEAGKVNVKFENTVGWSSRALPKYETVSQKEYVQLSYEALRNNYEFGNGMDHAAAVAQARADLGGKLGGEMYNPFKNYSFADIIDPTTEQVRSDAQSAWNDDWMDMLLNNSAPRHEHKLSVSGGTDRTQFLISLGYLNEEGILKNTEFQRYTGRANVDTKVNDWFKAGLNTSLAYTKSNYNQYVSKSSAQSNVFYTAQFISPLYPMYIKDAQGKDVLDAAGNRQYDYGEGGRPSLEDFNPLAGLYDDRSYTDSDNASIRTYLTFGGDKDSFGWAKGLKFTMNFGADYVSSDGTEMMNKYHGNQANAGGLLNRLIDFSIEYYNRKTTDMLLNYPMATSTGFNGYDANVGNIRNSGFEMMVGVTPIKTENVQWRVQWMGSTIRNRVLKLTQESNQIMNGPCIIKEGWELNTFYLPKSAGVDPLTGAPLYYAYEDMDDKGNVTGEYITTDYSKATTSKYFQGSRLPDLYGSISTTLNLFNCVDLSIMSTYSIGGKMLDYMYQGSMENMYYNNTWHKNALRRWQKPGDITDVPRIEIAGEGRSLMTDRNLVNASYFAIKNITLGYTLPRSITSKIGLSGVRLYGTAENIALWTHLKGMDPQASFTGTNDYTYTPNKSYTIGLEINF